MIFRSKRLRYPFEQRLLDIKRRVKPEPFDWYPFDSFANLTPIETLIPGGLQSLIALAGDEPLADFGAGDGDLAFLLEQHGLEVTAVDWPGTNANQMRGLELMRHELGSSISIRQIDIDSQFRLNGERFGLVLALGILYHLKNPYFFLDRLASHARYCLLGTRILADRTQDAIAYLARNREFANDTTNFWFFSEAGVQRLLDRCGWNILRQDVTGEGEDARFFCLAESRAGKNNPTIRLLDGWHELENAAWRWAGREFGVVLENVTAATRLELRFKILPELLAVASPLTVEAAIDGKALPVEEFAAPGDHCYSQTFGSPRERAEIRFRLSHSVRINDRDLGVIVRLPGDGIVDEDCGLRLI